MARVGTAACNTCATAWGAPVDVAPAEEHNRERVRDAEGLPSAKQRAEEADRLLVEELSARVELAHLGRYLDEQHECSRARAEAEHRVLCQHACSLRPRCFLHSVDLSADSTQRDRLADMHRERALDEETSKVPDVAARQLLVLEGELHPVEPCIICSHLAQNDCLSRLERERFRHGAYQRHANISF